MENTIIPYEIYTSGFVVTDDFHDHGGIGGYAFIVVRNSEILFSHKQIEPKYSDIFEMELKATAAALEYIDEIKYPQEEVIIYNNHKNVVECYLKEWWRNWMEHDWKNANRKPIAHRNIWWRIIPFFQKTRYRITYPPFKSNNYFNTLCIEHAQEAAAFSKKQYNQKLQEKFYATHTDLE